MSAPTRTTNEEVIAAAREILESGGPAGLTMQAVATRVGVRAPSLYKRFRDRDALLSAVAEASVNGLAELLETAAPDLARLASAYRRFAHENPESFRLIFTPSAPQDALQRSAAPVIRTAAALVGEGRALDAARLFTAWATGFVQMELDDAFDYGLRCLIRGLESDSGNC